MLLRDVHGWPPPLSSISFDRRSPSDAAILKGCTFYPAVDHQPAYLSIIIRFQGSDWFTALGNQPAPLLKRVEATLRSHHGKPLAELGDLQLVDP